MTTKRVATLGVLTGLSLVAFMIESLLPSIALPGAKIGISNVFGMLAVVLYGLPAGLILTVIRTTLGAIIVGNLSSLMYSLTAGLVSITLTYLLYRVGKRSVSLIAISVAAAVTHNLVQNAVFCLVTRTAEGLILMPYLGLFGILSGITVGLIVLLILKTIPASVWGDLNEARKGGTN